MQFGYFNDERRDYVITQPDTPLPWINYLGCEAYFGIISNTADGYSFYQDARHRKLIRYRYNNAHLYPVRRYLYLRDNDSPLQPDEPLYWSPTWQPVRRPLDEYEYRPGLGYTTIRSKLSGNESQPRYFVPLGESLGIWELSLTNQRTLPANLSIYSAIEFCLWDAWDDATNFQRNLSVGQIEVVDKVFYHKTEYRERRNHFAYFTCSDKTAGFDTQREVFLGAYRGWDSPAAVEAGQMSVSIAYDWQPIGVQHIKLHLVPWEERKIIFILGYHENPVEEKFDPPGSQTINKRTVRPIIESYLKSETVECAFQSLRAYWDGLLGQFQVKTPDVYTNRMVNIWNAYQTMITFNMSRSVSYFESGIGRGMGFRDSNQDLLGFTHMVSEQARERILDLVATQLPGGGAYHQYSPLTKRGNHDIGSNFNDDPLWLVLAATAYLKETGDFSLLDESVPYDNRSKTEEPLIGHLQRSIQYPLDRLSPHGLPLNGRADWNDCLTLNCFSVFPGESFQTTSNKDGQIAESVFIAGLFVLAVNEKCALADYLGEEVLAQAYSKAAQEMEASIWSVGWGGEWFVRAYDDFGQVLGPKENEERRIFIEPQEMCVMAGLGMDDGRAFQALSSVDRYLATLHGSLLQQPAFSKYYLHLGEISSYPPGYKENAGIFCHTTPWVMIAGAIIGRGEKALDYYLRINPSVREQISEIYKCEPYAYAQMIAGKDAPTYGEAKNSWLTGTAAWNYVAITQWILGIHPTYMGLQVAPVIPSSWEGFKAVRNYQGARYEIKVERVGAGNRTRVKVNGEPIQGNIVPLSQNKSDIVNVFLTLE